MRAAVCREFAKPLEIEDLQLATPQAGEVRVAIKASGICHSDLTYLEGAWGGDLPAVYGHEVAGIIDEVGPGLETLKPGQRVVVSLLRACGRCLPCITGEPAVCVGTLRLDAETPLGDANGLPVYQGLRTAGFAESTVVHASQVVALPDDIAFESACLLGCAVITGFGAVVNTAGVLPGESVAVIGTGGVGLNAVQGAAIVGAYPVVAVDIRAEKLKRAEAFGATHGINAAHGADRQLRDLAGGHLADVVIVAAGSSDAIEQGLRMIRRGGRLVVVGMPGGPGLSRLDATLFAYKGQRILGSKMGSTVPQVDIPKLIALYRQGRLKLDELVSGRYALEEINPAIAESSKGETVRNVIVSSA